MTEHYAQNAAYAEALVPVEWEGEFAIMSDVRNQLAINQISDFTETVANSEARLYGGAGSKFQLQKDRGEVITILDHKAAQKKIDNGLLAFKKTEIGGCMSREVCDAYGIGDMLPLPCLNCKEAVIDSEKVRKYRDELKFNLSFEEAEHIRRLLQQEIDYIDMKFLESEAS